MRAQSAADGLCLRNMGISAVQAAVRLSRAAAKERLRRHVIEPASWETILVPWRPGDAPRHAKKAMTPELCGLWNEVANKTLSETQDDARAVRTANTVVRRVSSRTDGLTRRAMRQSAFALRLASTLNCKSLCPPYLINDAGDELKLRRLECKTRPFGNGSSNTVAGSTNMNMSGGRKARRW